MNEPKPKLDVGEIIGKYKIIKIIKDKHIRYLCVHIRGWKEMFFEEDLLEMKGGNN